MRKIFTNSFSAVFFFLLLCSSNPTHINADDLISILDQGYFFPYPEKCSELLDSFAQYASNFTMCSIQNARPIRLCQRCVDHFIRFRDKYQELLTTVVNGTSCKEVFLSRDRLDAILDYHDNILAVWKKGHCDDCFTWLPEGPTTSNDTKRFTKMFNETTECIITNYKLNNSEEVCKHCMQSYLTLDEFYKTLSKDGIGVDSVCMDVVDMMNATRSVWSKTLNCCRLRRSPEVIFLCCTGIISFLPLLYYLTVRYYGPIRDLPNVLKQSRFKQKFLRSRNDIVNNSQ